MCKRIPLWAKVLFPMFATWVANWPLQSQTPGATSVFHVSKSTDLESPSPSSPQGYRVWGETSSIQYALSCRSLYLEPQVRQIESCKPLSVGDYSVGQQGHTLIFATPNGEVHYLIETETEKTQPSRPVSGITPLNIILVALLIWTIIWG